MSMTKGLATDMCSRFSLTSPPEAVRSLFNLDEVDLFPPRYNIAPTQPIMIVRRGHQTNREAVLTRWGLIPAWVKDPREFATLINARGETVADKPSFRGSFRHRRCLIPTDGFYEWTGKPGAKQPHLVRLASRQLFTLAGLFDTWLGADGSEIDTAAIITTAANADMAEIHDRMPVIVSSADFEQWLDCRSGTGVDAAHLIRPLADGLLDIVPVDRRLNNPRIEGPDLQAAIERPS